MFREITLKNSILVDLRTKSCLVFVFHMVFRNVFIYYYSLQSTTRTPTRTFAHAHSLHKSQPITQQIPTVLCTIFHKIKHKTQNHAQNQANHKTTPKPINFDQLTTPKPIIDSTKTHYNPPWTAKQIYTQITHEIETKKREYISDFQMARSNGSKTKKENEIF